MKVLWLASWYPSALMPLSGDFIKRHAEAVSLYEQLHVLHVIRDASGRITRDVSVKTTASGNLTETIVYYYIKSFKPSVLNKIFSEWTYRRLFKKQVIKHIIDQNPDLVHVHVGMKAGNIARWIKRKYQIPYVVSEHWTGLLKEAEDNLSKRSLFWKHSWEKVIQQAAAISAVSAHLAQSIKTTFNISRCEVIPNVVNTNIFYTNISQSPNRFIKFLHISTLDAFKNPLLILQAFAIVVKTQPEVMLTVVGPEKEEIQQWIRKEKLEQHIKLRHEMSQPELATLMQKQDALVLYSRYETFGCVVIEANACGKPVIVSDIPVFHETVKEGVNGLFAPSNNIMALAQTIKKCMEESMLFNAEKISEEATAKYSYQTIGKTFSEWYKTVLSK